MIWVSRGTVDESSKTFQQNDRGLTGIEGLALLREHPNFFKFRMHKSESGSHLTDIASGRKIPVVGLEQTVCTETIRYHEWVMALYRCRYMHERKASMKAGIVHWDIDSRAKYDIVPCTLGDIFVK